MTGAKDKNLISIIVATYNSGATVLQTLSSIISQTHTNWEVILQDGGSIDDTIAIARALRDDRINIHEEQDLGIYDAMNKGISKANGVIIGILNSDDMYASSTILETIAKVFIDDADMEAVYGNISFFDDRTPDKVSRYWKSKPYYESFFEDGNVPPHPSLYLRSSVYDKVGRFNLSLEIGADYEFMLRMLRIHKIRSYYLDKTVVNMRLGGKSTAGLRSLVKSFKEVNRAWEINQLEKPSFFYVKRYIKKLVQLVNKSQ